MRGSPLETATPSTISAHSANRTARPTPGKYEQASGHPHPRHRPNLRRLRMDEETATSADVPKQRTLGVVAEPCRKLGKSPVTAHNRYPRAMRLPHTANPILNLTAVRFDKAR